jgi:uncharacterized protein YjbI with pentapeptide repeats
VAAVGHDGGVGTRRQVVLVALVVAVGLLSSACLGSGEDSTIGDCNIRAGATCPGNYMRGARLVGADLWGANLTRADMSGTVLVGANLSGAKLTGTNLTHADLTGADLSGADLRHATLTGTKLTGANLTGAALVDAKGLSEAQLEVTTVCRTVVDVEGLQVDRDCRGPGQVPTP